MFSNLQIYRSLAKKDKRMNLSGKTVSDEAMQDEWELIQAAQSDSAHFRPLYNRYFDPIFRFVFRRTADREITGDICSQVFLKALQKLPNYEFKGVPFSAWLYRIASNEITQHFRNNQRNRVISIGDDQLNSLVDEIEDTKLMDIHQENLVKALDQLNEKDVLLIEMRFFEQRPFKEIADILEITESNAKVKTYRILDKLKKIMRSN